MLWKKSLLLLQHWLTPRVLIFFKPLIFWFHVYSWRLQKSSTLGCKDIRIRRRVNSSFGLVWQKTRFFSITKIRFNLTTFFGFRCWKFGIFSTARSWSTNWRSTSTSSSCWRSASSSPGTWTPPCQTVLRLYRHS